MKRILIAFSVVAVMAVVGMAANEITTSVFLKVKNGAYEVQRNVANYLDNQANNSADQGVMSVTPTATAIPINNVTDPKWTYLRHVGGTGTISVTCTILLSSNDTALLPLSTTNIQATASAGTTNKLEYWINQR